MLLIKFIPFIIRSSSSKRHSLALQPVKLINFSSFHVESLSSSTSSPRHIFFSTLRSLTPTRTRRTTKKKNLQIKAILFIITSSASEITQQQTVRLLLRERLSELRVVKFEKLFLNISLSVCVSFAFRYLFSSQAIKRLPELRILITG